MRHPGVGMVLLFQGALHLRDSEELVRVRLAARSEDPLAVRLTVDTREDSVTWVFARELLLRGLRSTVGEGSVRVRPIRQRALADVVEVVLDGIGGSAVLLLPRGPVAHFLDASDPLVLGEDAGDLLEEDLDRALGEILASRENQDPSTE